MAYILTITGKSDSGKTATAHRIHKILIKDANFIPHTPLIGGVSIPNGDFIDILLHNKTEKRIGIISQGDYLKSYYYRRKEYQPTPRNKDGDFSYSLVAHIKFLISKDCDIIICCACMEQNKDVFNEIKSEFPKPHIIIDFHKKQRIDDGFIRSYDENKVANDIINYLKRIL